jgi:hypothetical protein
MMNYMNKEINEKIIKDAQFRKGLSIAFFNATNNAADLISTFYSRSSLEKQSLDSKKAMIVLWRDWMLDEHLKYYGEVINKIGVNYQPKLTIDKLNLCSSYDDLSLMWRQLSEDERRDKEIIEVVKKLKAKFLKPEKVIKPKKNEKTPSSTTNKRVVATKKRKNNRNDIKVNNGNTES